MAEASGADLVRRTARLLLQGFAAPLDQLAQALEQARELVGVVLDYAPAENRGCACTGCVRHHPVQRVSLLVTRELLHALAIVAAALGAAARAVGEGGTTAPAPPPGRTRQEWSH
jgi:hypothetical protein